jgi:hypothetical protein
MKVETFEFNAEFYDRRINERNPVSRVGGLWLLVQRR